MKQIVDKFWGSGSERTGAFIVSLSVERGRFPSSPRGRLHKQRDARWMPVPLLGLGAAGAAVGGAVHAVGSGAADIATKSGQAAAAEAASARGCFDALLAQGARWEARPPRPSTGPRARPPQGCGARTARRPGTEFRRVQPCHLSPAGAAIRAGRLPSEARGPAPQAFSLIGERIGSAVGISMVAVRQSQPKSQGAGHFRDLAPPGTPHPVRCVYGSCNGRAGDTSRAVEVQSWAWGE